jgi:hypothetical protein
MSRRGIALPLTEDHKPDLPAEKQRIEKAGGVVRQGLFIRRLMGPYRVYNPRMEGGLAVSRSIGDAVLKRPLPLVSATPEVNEIRLEPELDEFIVLASDGLWDVFSNIEVVEFVRKRGYLKRVEPKVVSQQLISEALHRGSMDNITVLVVYLRPPEIEGALSVSGEEGRGADGGLEGSGKIDLVRAVSPNWDREGIPVPTSIEQDLTPSSVLSPEDLRSGSIRKEGKLQQKRFQKM